MKVPVFILRCLEGWLYIIFRFMVDLVLEQVHTGLAQPAIAGLYVVRFLTFLADLAVVGEVCFRISCSVS